MWKYDQSELRKYGESDGDIMRENKGKMKEW
jgi:hypothetical protein